MPAAQLQVSHAKPVKNFIVIRESMSSLLGP